MSKLRIGFVLTGSFCTFSKVMPVIQALIERGDTVTPILSDSAGTLDTRFGTAAHWREELTALTGVSPIDSIVSAEPIGPKALFDILIVAPCTGNTLARLAHGLTDTPATMAVKSHLRGERPVVLAVSTNDGLAGSARNIGELLARKNYYFVPFGQDDPKKKPTSLVADFRLNQAFRQLDTLPQALRDKVEFLCNECCAFGCRDRAACYRSVSRENLGLEGPVHRCTAPDAQGGYRFSKAMKNPAFISVDDIRSRYLPMGFSNFKIEGRGLGSALILEFLLYYMTKPEYHLPVREEVYLSNTLDLF